MSSVGMILDVMGSDMRCRVQCETHVQCLWVSHGMSQRVICSPALFCACVLSLEVCVEYVEECVKYMEVC